MPTPTLVRSYPASGTLGVSDSGVDTTFTTTIDTTGLGTDGLVLVHVAFSGAPGGNQNTTGWTITTKTLGSDTLTETVSPITNAGSNSAGAALLSKLNPTSGASQTLTIICHSVTGSLAASRVAVHVDLWSNTGSIGNVATPYNDDSGLTSNQNHSVTAASTAVAYASGSHGDVITGVASGTTICGAVNNFSTDNAGGCVVAGYKAGAGGSTTLGFTSSLSDHWIIFAVELVAATGVTGTIAKTLSTTTSSGSGTFTAPAPTLNSPANNLTDDLTDGEVFTWTHNGGGAQTEFAFRRRGLPDGTWEYWNGTGWQSSEIFNSSATQSLTLGAGAWT